MTGAGWVRIDAWRADFGATAGVWSGTGRHAVEDGRWLALSGASSPAFNVALCWAGGSAGGVGDTRADLVAFGRPAVLMLAGEALGWAQVMADEGWVCVGSVPFMRLDLQAASWDPDAVAGARRLGPAELAAAREVFREANDAGPGLPEQALPETAVRPSAGGQPVASCLWGSGRGREVVSVALVCRAGTTVAVWSMATSPRFQRQGLGHRLLQAVLADAAASGADDALLVSSPSGLALYRSLGFQLVERWQQWSRPRWVLGRS